MSWDLVTHVHACAVFPNALICSGKKNKIDSTEGWEARTGDFGAQKSCTAAEEAAAVQLTIYFKARAG